MKRIANKLNAKVFLRIRNLKTRLANYFFKKRVRNKNFTIIASNCWGSTVYQELGLPYTTPFVGLLLYAPCYLKLISRLTYYLKSNLSFVTTSKYDFVNKTRIANSNYYPIGILGNDVEVHFLHYKSESDACEKWQARIGRMNMNNLFVAFSEKDLCAGQHLADFDQLDYPHKVVFTARRYPNIRSAVCINEFSKDGQVGEIYTNAYLCKRHFDIADWLNGGTGKVRIVYKIVNRLLEVVPK